MKILENIENANDPYEFLNQDKNQINIASITENHTQIKDKLLSVQFAEATKSNPVLYQRIENALDKIYMMYKTLKTPYGRERFSQDPNFFSGDNWKIDKAPLSYNRPMNQHDETLFELTSSQTKERRVTRLRASTLDKVFIIDVLKKLAEGAGPSDSKRLLELYMEIINVA